MLLAIGCKFILGYGDNRIRSIRGYSDWHEPSYVLDNGLLWPCRLVNHLLLH